MDINNTTNMDLADVKNVGVTDFYIIDTSKLSANKTSRDYWTFCIDVIDMANVDVIDTPIRSIL